RKTGRQEDHLIFSSWFPASCSNRYTTALATKGFWPDSLSDDAQKKKVRMAYGGWSVGPLRGLRNPRRCSQGAPISARLSRISSTATATRSACVLKQRTHIRRKNRPPTTAPVRNTRFLLLTAEISRRLYASSAGPSGTPSGRARNAKSDSSGSAV